MKETEHWEQLSEEDFRDMLVKLIGYRHGEHPEEHLEAIRAERSETMDRFVRFAGLAASDRVLELGSGCGFGTRTLARQVREVLACDISSAFLAVARRELADRDNVQFHLVKSRDLSLFEADSVDAVVSVAVFIHFNLYDIHCYFKEIKRILKPKGKVVFDFADSDRIGSPLRGEPLREQFLEHAAFYSDAPEDLPLLTQWNSAVGISRVARLCGFRKVKFRGNKLLFRLG